MPATERALRLSGLEWTMLRNNLYTHLQVPAVEQAVASGRLFSNSGSGAAAYVTREDCAAVAAAVLTQGGHVNEVVDVTGPESVTAFDMVTLAREISGRDVELVDVDDHVFAEGLRQAGLPEAGGTADHLLRRVHAPRVPLPRHFGGGRPDGPRTDRLRRRGPRRTGNGNAPANPAAHR